MSKNKLKMAYPASWWNAEWREALPSGNGEIGAAVYGGVHEETIMMTHTDLWWKDVTQEMPDVSDQLPEVRRLLFEKDPRRASDIIGDALQSKGYSPKMASPLPLGDIKIFMSQKHAFKAYSRELNMENGEVSVTWKDGNRPYKRDVFVSRADDMIVCRITSDGMGAMEAEIQLDLHDRRDGLFQIDNITINVTDDLENFLPQQLAVECKENYLYYAARNEDGTDFGAVAKIIASDIICDEGKIRAVDDAEILLLIKVFIKGERAHAWKALEASLEEVSMGYDTLLERHHKIHERLLNASTLDLYTGQRDATNEALLMEAYSNDMPTALVEKMWAFGRYLLISSSKEKGNPCHMYGLWCGEYQGMWAFNMLNENVQMIYWHALSGNMPELLIAVFDYYEKRIEDFRTNAKHLFGCRGIYIPASTTPESGLLKLVLPHLTHWTGGAGWLCQHYYDYYLHTGDLEFLKNRALPMMKEAALFYEDFFLIGEDGYYISCPSNSPENTPGNYWDQRGMNDEKTSMATTINATMDFAIARELISHLIEGSQEVQLNSDQLSKWEGMLKRIPPYELNEDGAVKEWMCDDFTDNYHHRHESHVYPIFPGIEVTKDNNPDLFEGFAQAVKKRLVIGLKEQSGWSLAHMANNYARMGEGDQALECLDIISRSCLMKNLYTTHNDWRGMGIGVDSTWAAIQMDANMGWCSAMNEMLMFSVPGTISILPALPNKWQKGKIERLLARGAIEVSIEWDIVSQRAKVMFLSKKRDCRIDLILPDFVDSAIGYDIKDNQRTRKVYGVLLEAGKKVSIEMGLKKGQ